MSRKEGGKGATQTGESFFLPKVDKSPQREGAMTFADAFAVFIRRDRFEPSLRDRAAIDPSRHFHFSGLETPEHPAIGDQGHRFA